MKYAVIGLKGFPIPKKMPRQSGKSNWKRTNAKRSAERRALRDEALRFLKIRIRGKTPVSVLEAQGLRKLRKALAQEAKQKLRDQLSEVPADRREFYFAWKNRTEKVIGILQRMHGHVLREFFEVEDMEASRHQAELEAEQRGNEFSEAVVANPPVLMEDSSAEFR